MTLFVIFYRFQHHSTKIVLACLIEVNEIRLHFNTSKHRKALFSWVSFPPPFSFPRVLYVRSHFHIRVGQMPCPIFQVIEKDLKFVISVGGDPLIVFNHGNEFYFYKCNSGFSIGNRF